VSIRYGLLALLSKSPMYGYQLRTEFEASTGGTWPLNVGQVYSTLQRLERDGLVVESEGSDEPHGPGSDRRRYELTDAGRHDLANWFASPVEALVTTRSELVIKVIMAASLPGVDVRSVIDNQRAECMHALQTQTRAKAKTRSNGKSSLVADSVIFNAEAEIRWLDHCHARLAGLDLEGVDG
jgi:DNA-binding PadR family transcriptional regulator